METADADVSAQVDGELQSWRQGDCVVGEHWFAFRTDIERPLTDAGAFAVSQETDLAESKVDGFVVVSQTCDIVRACISRPFVEVCPLVEVDDSALREVQRGRRPGYAFIPGLSDRRLVGDLDRVMTVEKSVVAGWNRVNGCQTDGDIRRLSQDLARKRARVAFPDDFVRFAEPLIRRLSEKHDKESPEGRALRALREIRVHAQPSWEAEHVNLIFWFIRRDDLQTFEGHAWASFLEAWNRWIPENGRFVEVQSLVQKLEELSAKDYVQSDPLDLDHLTARSNPQL